MINEYFRVSSIQANTYKSAIVKYEVRGAKYKLKVPRAFGSPEYAAAKPQGNFQLYFVICPLYIPTNSDLTGSIT